MECDNNKQALEWLRDWSKWLITIDFAAATGCTIVALNGATGVTLLLLTVATSAFALSALCAAYLVGATPSVIERLPSGEAAQKSRSVMDAVVGSRLSLRSLAKLQYVLTALGAVLFLSWFVAKASTQNSSREQDLRVTLSFTESQFSEYKQMVRTLGTLALEADVSFINLGDVPATITDLVIFVETVHNGQLVRWDPTEYESRSVSGSSKTWGLAQVTVPPRGIVKRYIDFGNLEVTSPDRETLVNKMILVGVEYHLIDSRGVAQIRREPVLSIEGGTVTRAPTVSRILGEAR